MLVPNQYFEIKIIKTNIDHYRLLGYDVQLKDVITIPAEHLTPGSEQKVLVRCDVCGELYEKIFYKYIKQHTYNMDTCRKCAYVKSQITCIERYNVKSPLQNKEIMDKFTQTSIKKYGVNNPTKNQDVINKRIVTNIQRYGGPAPIYAESVKEKMKQTNLERYGAECATQNIEIYHKIIKTNMEKYGVPCTLQFEEVANKIKQTNIEKYGVEYPAQSPSIYQKVIDTNILKYGYKNLFQSPEIQQKIKETNLQKYGCECSIASETIKAKIKNTMLEKYGCEHPAQNSEIMNKMLTTMKKNNTVPTSSQQIDVYETVKKKFLNVSLNYPFDRCSLDIFLEHNNIKIDIEYDGWYWHQDAYKDMKRDMFLESNGVKVLRIKSGSLLPTEEELFSAIDELLLTDRVFKEIILSDWNSQQCQVKGVPV